MRAMTLKPASAMPARGRVMALTWNSFTMSQATKALVFSAWTAVPDAIAAVCSYEAERRMVGAPDFRHSQLYDRVRPLLRFARASADDRLTGMPVIAWMLPCPRLASVVDPLRIAIDHGKGEPVDLEVLLAQATSAFNASDSDNHFTLPFCLICVFMMS